MREIKFKGYNKNVGWVYGFVTHSSGMPKIHNSEYPGGLQVYQDSVYEFTGCLDSRGEEIYEGDMVKTPQGAEYFVEYYEGSFWLKCDSTSISRLDGFVGSMLTITGCDDYTRYYE